MRVISRRSVERGYAGMTNTFKAGNNSSEWDIFQRVLSNDIQWYTRSKYEKILHSKIASAQWFDNTESRPDFVSDDLLIEMFEVDDIVTTRKGKGNPQRQADARAERDVRKFIKEAGCFNEDMEIIALGDPRFQPDTGKYVLDNTNDHHNYQAYVNNFHRICTKHLNNIAEYRALHPGKKLGFLIIDDATTYASELSYQDAFNCLPFHDKNFMKLFIKSDIDFVLWAFSNKYIYSDSQLSPHDLLPDVALISNDNFYCKRTRQFNPDSMISFEV